MNKQAFSCCHWNKGFAPILMILGVFVIVAIVGGAYFFSIQQTKPQPETVASPTSKTTITPSSAPATQPSPSITSIKKDSYTENTSVSNQKRYVSPKLGLSFLYLSVKDEQKVSVKEVDQKIYVYPTNLNMAYTDGQFVEVFNKSKNDTLAEAIKKQFLNGISEKDCFVVAGKYTKYYPESYSTAEISYPKSDDPNGPWWQIPPACPQDYSQTNGMRYFLGDSKHPEEFLFLSIGQYGIDAGDGNKMWQDTIQFLD